MSSLRACRKVTPSFLAINNSQSPRRERLADYKSVLASLIRLPYCDVSTICIPCPFLVWIEFLCPHTRKNEAALSVLGIPVHERARAHLLISILENGDA